VPLAEMPAWGRWLAPFSPLSYSADLIRAGFGGTQYFATVTSVAALLGFSTGFLVLTRVIHRATQSRAR
jgi:ABC-2 type transport system permease protein